MPSIRRMSGVLMLASWAWTSAAWAFPTPMDLIHGKSKKSAGPAIPKAADWKLAAGASQPIFVNQGKAAAPVNVYVCVDIKPHGRPKVDIRMVGRAPVEAGAGCQSVYLEVDAGERITLLNPGAEAASGSYKVAPQS